MEMQQLARLRMDLDFLPSPSEEHPGLLIRDSRGYSDAMLVIPPPLVMCLQLFDGEKTVLDLKEQLVRITGSLDVSTLQEHLCDTLSSAGFLHDQHFEALRDEAHRSFADAPLLQASHAGAAYPDDPAELRLTLSEYFSQEPTTRYPEVNGSLVGIAAPHVSPWGGWQTYRSAYTALNEAHRDRIFVVLGTSHYGEPDRFGLTRKPIVTPYGSTRPELRLIDELAGERAAVLEDYCHSVEHSIEFQIVFLQHLYGPEISVVPILCGSFARSICFGGMPEDDGDVARFLDRLANMAAREGKRLCWVLGIDMAHIGARYGDRTPAHAHKGRMLEVAERDQVRISSVCAGDLQAYWDLVRENEDDLRWCGSAPLYTFMKAVPEARGELRGYDQWQIDENSVVSFAGISFSKQ
jgi:AmmeMemoRadiSam system protein B